MCDVWMGYVCKYECMCMCVYVCMHICVYGRCVRVHVCVEYVCVCVCAHGVVGICRTDAVVRERRDPIPDLPLASWVCPCHPVFLPLRNPTP